MIYCTGLQTSALSVVLFGSPSVRRQSHHRHGSRRFSWNSTMNYYFGFGFDFREHGKADKYHQKDLFDFPTGGLIS